MIPACVGVIIPLATTNVAARYVGIFLMVSRRIVLQSIHCIAADLVIALVDWSVRSVHGPSFLASSCLSRLSAQKSGGSRVPGSLLQHSQYRRVSATVLTLR